MLTELMLDTVPGAAETNDVLAALLPSPTTPSVFESDP